MKPPTARTYSSSGLPWFEYYDADAQALAGADSLSKMASRAKLAEAKGNTTIGDGGGVPQIQTILLTKKSNPHEVIEGEF
jgi:hypothetical protein